jgi:hypothetical protein
VISFDRHFADAATTRTSPDARATHILISDDDTTVSAETPLTANEPPTVTAASATTPAAATTGRFRTDNTIGHFSLITRSRTDGHL